MPVYSVFFFFFQAEDGIRDGHVTGVQTCALPILRILEGRHARMVERLAMLRSSTLRARDRMDAYTAELARHGLEQVEREVEWLENLIDTERGTPGALDLRAPGPAATPPAGPAGDEGDSFTTTHKEQE